VSSAAHISFFNDPARRPPRELLEAWPTLVDVAEAAAAAGVRVSVLQNCAEEARLEARGVHYHFLPFGVHGLRGGNARLAAVVRSLAPQVLHVHGLGFCRDVLSLAALLPELPLVLQDHASRPPRLWRRPQWRRALAAASAVTFCAAEQAQPFAAAGLLSARTAVHALPESTSRFTPGDQQQARRRTGVHGDPAVLWVGHLDGNKDPLTMLAGVSDAARHLPDLRLWCCFGAAPLLAQVEERVRCDPHLCGRVYLLGRLPHARIEELMRAADVFVLASHREGSGYALIEALACGLPPVVTDIPSFRALTGGGAVGALWPCGDAPTLGRALQAVTACAGGALRTAVRRHFERELSSAALGAKLAELYRAVSTHHGRHVLERLG
jgi:glycosyltransferase involved in cell wall biosynthesis